MRRAAVQWFRQVAPGRASFNSSLVGARGKLLSLYRTFEGFSQNLDCICGQGTEGGVPNWIPAAADLDAVGNAKDIESVARERATMQQSCGMSSTQPRALGSGSSQFCNAPTLLRRRLQHAQTLRQSKRKQRWAASSMGIFLSVQHLRSINMIP